MSKSPTDNPEFVKLIERAKSKKLPKDLLDLIDKVEAARPKRVLAHILREGYVTTEELHDQYDYHHPPRARMDVLDNGVPLVTFKVSSRSGTRKIAAYTIGDPADAKSSKLGGRKAFPKALKKSLVARDGAKCSVCFAGFDENFLQVDHRLPFEIFGDPDLTKVDEFMLLCPSCQRRKSWACEHCKNFTTTKKKSVCEKCFWATPSGYSHVALTETRALELLFAEEEVAVYEVLAKAAAAAGEDVQVHAKQLLKALLKGR
ncbi:MAG: HNH endonuclease [Anaeromyxobacter sp.]|nr:HNH endonuclease [Anaeromyxobacter sp.]